MIFEINIMVLMLVM